MSSSNAFFLIGTILHTLHLLGWPVPSEFLCDCPQTGVVQIILFHVKKWIFSHNSSISFQVHTQVYVCVQRSLY